MMIYSVYDVSDKQAYDYYSLSSAKKKMKELMAEGHEVTGSKMKMWANGDWEPAGEITLSGSNKTFFANTKQKKPNY